MYTIRELKMNKPTEQEHEDAFLDALDEQMEDNYNNSLLERIKSLENQIRGLNQEILDAYEQGYGEEK